MSIEVIEKRQDRIEDAIERLTDISADLNKMLAVQDQRLLQQEKEISIVLKTIEDRRKEWDDKLDGVYNTMRSEDHQILNKLDELKNEQKSQHDKILQKVNDMQKIIWMYMGGFSVIIFLLTNGAKILALLGSVN
jgi:DNA repair exonuclease SbcCD ATPase subunit